MRVGARDGGRGDDVMALKVLVTTYHQWENVRGLEQTKKDKKCEFREPERDYRVK